jgi:hypothetical protein
MDNLYQPPKAELLDEQSQARSAFFVTSLKKFYLLYFTTFSLYTFYWFYKQWDLQRSAMLPKKIWPAARSIFQIFFTHSLCRLISEHKQHLGQAAWSYSGTAWAYVILTIVTNRLSRIDGPGGALELLILFAIIMVPAMPLALIQQQANQASGDENGQSNATISGLNLLCMAPGALLWLLFIGALFIGE